MANQQTGYTDPNNNITATYSYNPDGLRKNKVVNGITTSYGWDGDDIVMETTAGTPTTFVRGLQLVSNNTGTTAANANYYLHDGHGNVTYLADNSGTITESYRYDAFGEQLNTVTDTNPFQYCGEYIDAETGSYYLRARNYVPTLGRFTQWDSYNGEIENPTSLNHYVYCYNDPISYVDSTGYAAETILDLVSAGVSLKELIEDPSWENLGWLGLDALALGVPFIPASGTVKYLDDVSDAGKLVDKGADVVEAIGKAATKRADKIDGVVKNIDEFNGTSIFTGTSRPRNSGAHPNSIYEQLNADGTVKSRAFYDENGRLFSRQDFDHEHFDKTTQQYYQPHEHNYRYNQSGYRDGAWDGKLPAGYSNSATK